jgi:hypothetical protein
MCSNGFTLIINSVGNQDDKSIRINWTFQLANQKCTELPTNDPKMAHFSDLTATTIVQLNNPLPAKWGENVCVVSSIVPRRY